MYDDYASMCREQLVAEVKRLREGVAGNVIALALMSGIQNATSPGNPGARRGTGLTYSRRL